MGVPSGTPASAIWLRRFERAGRVEVAFLMGPEEKTTRFQDMVARLSSRGAREIVVVPLLMSSHSGHHDQIQWLARRANRCRA